MILPLSRAFVRRHGAGSAQSPGGRRRPGGRSAGRRTQVLVLALTGVLGLLLTTSATATGTGTAAVSSPTATGTRCATARACIRGPSAWRTTARPTDASWRASSPSTATTGSVPFTRARTRGRPSTRSAGSPTLSRRPARASAAPPCSNCPGRWARCAPARSCGPPPPARTRPTAAWRCGSGGATTWAPTGPTCPRARSRAGRAACGNRSSRWPPTARSSAITPMRPIPRTVRNSSRRAVTTGCAGKDTTAPWPAAGSPTGRVCPWSGSCRTARTS